MAVRGSLKRVTPVVLRGMRRPFSTASATPTKASVNAFHWEDNWSVDDWKSRAQEHTMSTWGPSGATRSNPLLVRGEGPYLFDSDGKRWLDWTSQAICVNLGYTVPQTVLDAVQTQLKTLPMVYGGLGQSEPRIRLATLLAELLPGDLTGFLFPSSGSEANEAAIRMARRFTGRTKVINHYRSYHGGTGHSLNATGDFRRGFVESVGAAPGFIKTMNPTDSAYFSFGTTDEERTAKALGYLEEQILCEQPQTIAAIMVESLIGSAGVFIAPKGYMEGVRALCDKYGIVMIADEVMVGFGRTGKLWGFQHYDILPDIVTSAKGLTGAYLPLSMVAVRSKIKEFFEVNPLGWGATFHAHPVCISAGYECVKYLLEKDLVNHAKNNLEPVMKSNIAKLVDKYPSVARGRAHGAFSAIDLEDPKTGKPIQGFDGSMCSNPAAVAAFKAALKHEGIYGFIRPPVFHCAPPLVITPDQLEEGYECADRALSVFDKACR